MLQLLLDLPAQLILYRPTHLSPRGLMLLPVEKGATGRSPLELLVEFCRDGMASARLLLDHFRADVNLDAPFLFALEPF